MAWLDPKIQDLAKQLAYSPADKRAEQLAGARQLLPQIELDKSYPWEFVLFRITGYRPAAPLAAPVEYTIAGPTLRADLAGLIEFLSDSLSTRVADAAGPVLSVEQVARRFNVSSKTIGRWRRQGLAAQRFIFPDGRRRLGFLHSALEQFVAANQQRINRSATFRHLSEREKQLITRWARRLAARGQSLKEVADRIARQLTRSPQTIRQVIRNFDRDHAVSAIFPGMQERLGESERQLIVDLFDRGTSVDGLARQFSRTRAGIYRVVTQSKAQRLKDLPIHFVTNPLFDHPEADTIILEVLPRESRAAADKRTVEAERATLPHHPSGQDALLAGMPRDLPAYLMDIFRQPVLPPEVELDAFRRMNYALCKASRLQAQLNVETARSAEIAEIESLLKQASALKNQIIPANLRVVVYVARQHVRPGLELTELVSDGSMWLMRAADNFDFSRGVKFSTYASYSLMKNFARGRVEQIARPDRRVVTGQEELLNQLQEREGASISDQLDLLHMQGNLLKAVQILPVRERLLVSAHFGLNPSEPAMSLAQLGQKMGITKSRVRQLETRALCQLRLLMEKPVSRRTAV